VGDEPDWRVELAVVALVVAREEVARELTGTAHVTHRAQCVANRACPARPA
jgi:hypothetical protein